MTEPADEDDVSGPEKDREAQTPERAKTGDFSADDVDADDPHKAEKLAKAGRADDPQEASE